MNSIVGRFHVKEIDKKQYLVYYLDNNYLSVSTLFLCPFVRMVLWRKRYIDLYGEEKWNNIDIIELDSSPYNFNDLIQGKNEKERLDFDNHDHNVLPLFWCKNRDGVNYGYCNMCFGKLEFGTDYYFCDECDNIYHRECVESPSKIKHPYHPDHPLKLSTFREKMDNGNYRTKGGKSFVYHCTLCNVSMDTISAMKSIPFVIEKTKRHDHFLTFFTRKDHLCCNVCGLISKNHQTYACMKCDFVVHQDCVDFPSVIRISRHHHRISFNSFLPLGKWYCGVCRKDVDSDYGAYTCNKCDGYVVHSRCALRKDIWDGKELDGISEEDDIEEIVEPFKRISDELILHFLHKHALKQETSGEVYDENKICHACVLPIYEGKFYSCMECDFILHDDCANAPRRKRHPLHPNPLTLKITSEYDEERYFTCDACFHHCSGFIYECNISDSCFKLDIRCASIAEPFVYQGHEHPLFLALDPQEKHLCQVCQKDNRILINCIECDYIICLRCVNLPYMVKYKHDKHFLTLVHGKETNEPNWCEVCEKLLISSKDEEKAEEDDGEEDGEDKRFYECKQCCVTLHINCLLGKTPYLKPGHSIYSYIQIVANNSPSRPFCRLCGDRCVDKIFFIYFDATFCSLVHSFFSSQSLM